MMKPAHRQEKNYASNYAVHKRTKRAKTIKVQALTASVISRPCQERHWLEIDLMTTAKPGDDTP